MAEWNDRREIWARFRFSVVGPLLAAPPEKGDLQAEIEKLAGKRWRHPVTGTGLMLGRSTIERWYYAAKNARHDPVGELRRRVRKDAGVQPSLSAPVRAWLRKQSAAHRGWSYRLHYDNLLAQAKQQPEWGRPPSYPTVRRWMRSQALIPRRGRRRPDTPGAQAAEARLEQWEVRSYEAAHVGGLWHADFHVGRRKVLIPSGQWAVPHVVGVLDDASRLGCHAQWYLTESAETFGHGLMQALQKRGLPWALMTDNGKPMLAAETQEGLARLGIRHEPTLPYSPYQNAKQEVFWAALEGRLMAMLEGVAELTLEVLNTATQAWLELEYNRKLHSEIGTSPLDRYLAGPSVLRESPGSDELRCAFRRRAARQQRRSDGTITLEGRRYEIPSRYRHLGRVGVAYAAWDLGRVDLLDLRTGTILCALYPLDKQANADGRRRRLEPVGEAVAEPTPPASGLAPLLAKLMADYQATGLPPAYLPKEERR